MVHARRTRVRSLNQSTNALIHSHKPSEAATIIDNTPPISERVNPRQPSPPNDPLFESSPTSTHVPSNQPTIPSLASRDPPSLIPATRSRSELDSTDPSNNATGPHLSSSIDVDNPRAYKRQRIDNSSLPIQSDSSSSRPEQSTVFAMRYTESDQPSPSNSTSPDVMTGATTDTIAGPSSRGLDSLVHSNGHTPGTSKGYSFSSNGLSNGSSSVANGNGVMQKHGKSSIARVNLPGTLLYEDSNVDREEFVRLVLQSLRDVGYKQAAAALEAESGYSMESSEVGQFKQYILDGLWSKAEASLTRLGLTNEAKLWDARFLINRQKYLELLEAGKTTAALHVLRNEISPLNVESEELHTLSSLIMSTSPDDLRQRTNWDGAAGSSRQQLLADLHHYIPPSVMIPSRRFSTLLQQAHLHQLQRCTFHNIPANATPLSLYADHQCDNSAFPRMNTTVLAGHNDEVWHVEWSRAGDFLASASKDRSAILWRVGSDGTDWEAHQILRDHPYPVGCLSWSLDDSIILTSAENIIKMWNTQTGVCIRTITEHTETVTTLTWLSDGSGFISGGLDRKIIRWSSDGKTHEPWVLSPIRVVDLAISPDRSRLVTVGLDSIDSKPSPPSSRNGRGSGTPGESPNSGNGNGGQTNGSKATSDTRWVIAYDFLTREREFAKSMEGDLTSVKISQDCQYALINHSPDEIYMWDLNIGRLARKFTGQKQGRHIIRSCFGGVDGNFVVSGSEDGKVYVWHRDTGALLETLAGHGEGSVNAVAWNPGNERMFASCSDDRTIRIWEAPPLDGSVTSSLLHGSATAGPSSPSIGSSVDYKGKGKTRQLWDFADESGSATTSTRT